MIPDSIPFSSIDLGERGRTTYSNIDLLAESISQVGLIQPIVVEAVWPSATANDLFLHVPPHYLLRAGGRRYHALQLLGCQTLFHGYSSDPLYPGFLLANLSSDVLRGLLIELAENHDREDIDWKDDLRLLIRAYELYKNQELASPDADFSRNGLGALQRQFGAMTKTLAADLKHGFLVFAELQRNPHAFDDCNHIRAAYGKLCRLGAEHVAKIAAEKSWSKPPTAVAMPVLGQPDPGPQAPSSVVTIPLSASIHLGNGIEFMKSLPDGSIDHIVTDPDYAISIDRLSSNGIDATDGVVQEEIQASLLDLDNFIVEAFRITRGFCILFYDNEHNEKLMKFATRVGWRVQRWPLIWYKLDHRSNAAPNHNFPKSIEYAMVLRKPAATLAQVQTSCIYACSAGDTVRTFGHPFAKPLELWRWIYTAVAIKGQTVLDPFAGKGTAPCAAIQFGLKPIACEINEAHFGDLTLNLQAYYRAVIGTNIAFS